MIKTACTDAIFGNLLRCWEVYRLLSLHSSPTFLQLPNSSRGKCHRLEVGNPIFGNSPGSAKVYKLYLQRWSQGIYPWPRF